MVKETLWQNKLWINLNPCETKALNICLEVRPVRQKIDGCINFKTIGQLVCEMYDFE